ncbi:S-adenosyl-L-methionine-dependent methyltransferase [Crepidotus variabilis]|uniref:S-adenosyl-L-methionine-dependent methyltransferase n=1 Tax=Crepidotus variabilis TaxID=179855 RepID=A0A9P6EQV1_9AGAR|nr:S-adenosyl-L-methionine-dependent methyltransferase [Crepidotus variabilis]
MPLTVLEAARVIGNPSVYEDENVHAIYEEIAEHFSSTRYKPWPIIASFLSSLPCGFIGLDSGCGNGKYLPLPADRPGEVWTLGLDRSGNLLQIARAAGATGVKREVLRGDVLETCWRKGVFDYAISIATIHHLATEKRRRCAVKRLLEAVSPSHGRVLIYVWAIEQDELSKRKVFDSSSGGVAPHKGKDVVVPWVLSKEPRGKNKNESKGHEQTPPDNEEPKVYNRYYHMFAKGELRALVEEAAKELNLSITMEQNAEGRSRGLEIVQDGWERSNYYVELKLWESIKPRGF